MQEEIQEKIVDGSVIKEKVYATIDDFMKIEIKVGTVISVAVVEGADKLYILHVDLGEEKSLVMDIGGGSVEFIVCNQEKIFYKQSFEIGAALLLEQLKPSNPITEMEIKMIKTYLNKILASLCTACAKHKPLSLIGASGSFDTFAEMILNQKGKSPLGNKTSYQFNLEDYYNVHQQLINSTTQQRMQMKGLVKMRVDMIVLASLLLTFVLDKTKIKQMTLSAYALKEGILSEIMNNELSL